MPRIVYSICSLRLLCLPYRDCDLRQHAVPAQAGRGVLYQFDQLNRLITSAHTEYYIAFPPEAKHRPNPKVHSLTGHTPYAESEATMDGGGDPERAQSLQQYKDKLLESREWEAKLKALRMDIKGLQKEFELTEENIKALQSVGQIIGEVLKQLDEERCMSFCSLQDSRNH